MVSVPDILDDAVKRALKQLGIEGSGVIRPAKPQFGDYQANGILAEAKYRGENPTVLANKIISLISPELTPVCDEIKPLGPGFINFRLKPSFVTERIIAIAEDEGLGAPELSKHVIIDFSSPNVAKPMHVGHIRSTIIGDCLTQVMRFLGCVVETDNHIGDWGTQFGMLLVGWKRFRDDNALQRDAIAELERLYRYVNERAELRDEAKAELVKLQKGDAENVAIWQKIIGLSMQEFKKTYERLRVEFGHNHGESFYNSMLKDVVKELVTAGIARESEGAICVFFEDDPELKNTAPLIVQKADGGFLYATTDLATIKFRIKEFQPDEIIYVTDARQQLHFKQVFATARKWLKSVPELPHVYFGSILGEDGKPLKTREGTPVKLSALLDEAEERALAVVTEKNPNLSPEERQQIARAVGIGAVKYADLSQNRTTDYIFSWPKMLAMNGNTAPYMQYAYVRVQSIFRKAGHTNIDSAQVTLEHAAELDLAKCILRFPETLLAVAEDDKPNWLTGYLYDLTGKFSTFYENCPVLQSEEPTRSSRLLLCRLTADVIKQGLNLLGIEVIEQM